jgi:hypothetical protein
VHIDGQNGAKSDGKPRLKNSCGKDRRGKRKRRGEDRKRREHRHARKAG